ncbi:hypothetical protein THASP1DRAFT_33695 [Thamnocephalis sphaerospora]|uniref:Uncharacterized protein n=1 Tax=Thamnocephalis sphaerospora TaxID=78915 RepID=A0A4V1IVM0_9FUNG|nr:hypothetical protein THASP1DRAFT_33695 [Thamnocephalis sphaerospora]|eukprot:RKP04529.1 hypothetical protein THASP1DRAFT_33695 [Thamnocephalis sphaerospora]
MASDSEHLVGSATLAWNVQRTDGVAYRPESLKCASSRPKWWSVWSKISLVSTVESACLKEPDTEARHGAQRYITLEGKREELMCRSSFVDKVANLAPRWIRKALGTHRDPPQREGHIEQCNLPVRQSRFAFALQHLFWLRKPAANVNDVSSVVLKRQTGWARSLLVPPTPAPISAPSVPFWVNPQHVCYALPCIPDTFADGPRLDRLIEAVSNGVLPASALMPIRVRRSIDGNLYAVDCRRLYVLREAGVDKVTAIDMGLAMSADEVARAGGAYVCILSSLPV